jgi:hypothetical protein
MRKLILPPLLMLLPLFALADGPYLPPSNGSVQHISDDGVTATTVGKSNPEPVYAPAVSQINESGTVTTGGTFVLAWPASSARQAIEFQNICSVTGNCAAITDVCWLYIAAAGTPDKAHALVFGPSSSPYRIAAGRVPINAIYVTCDGNGDKFYLAVE